MGKRSGGGVPLASDAEALTQARLALADRFTLVAELGRGAATTVFRARDPRDGSNIILQLVHPDHGYDVGSERFVREISRLALLQDPQVLTPPGPEGQPAVLYYVRPDEPTESLRTRLQREGRLSRERALSFALDGALSLADLHARGWVHGAVGLDTIQLVGEHAFLSGVGGGFAASSGSSHAEEDVEALGLVLLAMLTGDERASAASLAQTAAPDQALLRDILTSISTPSAEATAGLLNEMLASEVRAASRSGSRLETGAAQ